MRHGFTIAICEIGFISIVAHPDRPSALVDEWHVYEGHRRKGFGARLLRDAAGRALESGIELFGSQEVTPKEFTVTFGTVAELGCWASVFGEDGISFYEATPGVKQADRPRLDAPYGEIYQRIDATANYPAETRPVFEGRTAFTDEVVARIMQLPSPIQ